MSYELDDAVADLRRLGKYRTDKTQELAAAGEPDDISGDLLIAQSSRESNCRPVNGGGHFDNEGRWINTKVDAGAFQISRDYHEAWLRSVPGCDEGQWEERYHDSEGAFPRDRVPGWTRSAKKALSILRGNRTYALGKGLTNSDALRCAIAGYNCGISVAVKAFQDFGTPDTYTTGHDYSADILERRSLIRTARRKLGWT